MPQAAVEFALRARDETQAAINSVGSRLDGLFKSGTKAFALGGAAIFIAKQWAEAAQAVAQFSLALAQTTEQLDRTSERTGTSIRQLQVWQEIIKEGGGDTQGLVTALTYLNRAIGQNDPLLRQLGIHTTDTGEAFKQLVNVLGNSADVGKRTEVAFRLMGRGSAELLPFLKAIATDSAKMEDALRSVGALIEGDTATKARKLDAAVDDLGRTWKGFTTTLGALTAPALTAVLKFFDSMLKGVMEFGRAIREQFIEPFEEMKRVRDELGIRTAEEFTRDASNAGRMFEMHKGQAVEVDPNKFAVEATAKRVKDPLAGVNLGGANAALEARAKRLAEIERLLGVGKEKAEEYLKALNAVEDETAAVKLKEQLVKVGIDIDEQEWQRNLKTAVGNLLRATGMSIKIPVELGHLNTAEVMPELRAAKGGLVEFQQQQADKGGRSRALDEIARLLDVGRSKADEYLRTLEKLGVAGQTATAALDSSPSGTDVRAARVAEVIRLLGVGQQQATQYVRALEMVEETGPNRRAAWLAEVERGLGLDKAKAVELVDALDRLDTVGASRRAERIEAIAVALDVTNERAAVAVDSLEALDAAGPVKPEAQVAAIAAALDVTTAQAQRAADALAAVDVPESESKRAARILAISVALDTTSSRAAQAVDALAALNDAGPVSTEAKVNAVAKALDVTVAQAKQAVDALTALDKAGPGAAAHLRIEAIAKALDLTTTKATALAEALDRVGSSGPVGPLERKETKPEPSNTAKGEVRLPTGEPLRTVPFDFDKVKKQQADLIRNGMTLRRLFESIAKSWDDMASDMLDTQQVLNDGLGSLFNGLQQGFGQVFQGLLSKGQTFRSAMRTIFSSLVSEILAMLARIAAAAVFRLLLKIIGGVISGGAAGAASAAVYTRMQPVRAGVGGDNNPNRRMPGQQPPTTTQSQTIIIQTFNPRDVVLEMTSPGGSLRRARARVEMQGAY